MKYGRVIYFPYSYIGVLLILLLSGRCPREVVPLECLIVIGGVPFYDCENFGPTFINGVVDESQPIKCHDSTMPSKWWSEHWQWSIEGKNLAGFVDDLKRAEGEIHGEYFVIGQNS